MAHIQCGRNVLRGLIKNGASQRGSDSITHPMLFASQGLRYRKLEVILTTSVENLGKAGETVKVAPGYFRNHLMAKMFDVPNIEKYAYLIREQRKSWKAVTTKAFSDPSGNYQGWKAAAIGANNQAA
ncbi:hypothetical protein MKW94_018297, partial [Papaver nudicaule]|nr:hypothetical protein [Papaver nudicaule]